MMASSREAAELVELIRALKQLHYRFTTVTPETHALVNARAGNEHAHTLQDVFGWNRPFSPSILPSRLFDLALAAKACEPLPGRERFRACVRVASFGDDLFVHSSFPTTATDAVFFGPDTYRFMRAVLAVARPAIRAVDVGAGSGVGGIVLSRHGLLREPVVLADVNARALDAARVNASANDITAEIVKSDILSGVPGDIDLVISNPPYLQDALRREYRHGGGQYGEQLASRIVHESLSRLARSPSGGTLLLYTGAAVVRGVDSFFNSIEGELRRSEARYSYEELDPDVFSSELRTPAYEDVERIAAVFLQARVESTSAR